MNIELRDIKYAAFASRETACFEAAVYIDSKREGTVTNDGHGGCNDYHPRELGQRIEAYASDKTEDNVDADMVIGNALDAALARRDLQRLLRTHIITMRGGRIYQTRAGRKDMLAELVERLRTQPHEQVLQRFGAEHVLNVMPFDEALRLFRAGTS